MGFRYTERWRWLDFSVEESGMEGLGFHIV